MPEARPSHRKLLVLTSTLPRWEGDPEPRFVLDLTRALLDRFDPLILAPQSPGAAACERIDGVAVRRYRYAPLRRWETLAAPGAIMPNLKARPWLLLLVPLFVLGQVLAIIRALRREEFDAIHCHWLVPQGLALALAGLFVRLPPVLTTCHGADAFTLDGPIPRPLKHRILRKSAAISVVSQEIAEHLRSRFGIDKRQLHHLPMGVDLQRFTKAARVERAAEPTILFAGRLAAKKGVHVLLQAFADPRLERRGARLKIIGNGPLGAVLRQRAIDHGIGERVSFVPALSHDELIREMGSAHLFCAPFVVSPDGDREGTPTILLEAAAAGLPILASDIGGCSDIVEHGKTGWLLPPGDSHRLADALVEALDDPANAATMARGALGCAQRFDWSRVADRHSQLINAIIEEPIPMESSLDPLFGAVMDDGWFPSPAHVLRRAVVLDAVRDLPPGRLLEMGCGAGRFLADWHELGHHGHAADLDPTARALAGRCARKFGANFTVADAPPPGEEKGFDYLVATEVLEHIDDPLAALRSWAAYLKDGGMLVATVPAFARLWGRSDEWAGHVQRFEPAAFRSLVEAAGFEVLSSTLYGYPVGNIIRVAGNAASGWKMRQRRAPEMDRHAATLSSGRDRSIEARMKWLFRSPLGRAVLRLGISTQRFYGRRGKGHGLIVVARKAAGMATSSEPLCFAA